MNTEQLKTFLSLVETKNFTRTAENLIVSQSTVSKRIVELEKEIDQKLFTRGKGGVTLTRAGKSFANYAGQIINLEDKALIQIKRTNQYTDYLVIGSVYAYYDIHLHGYIRQFCELYPEISVRIKVGHTGLVLNELKRALIDIAFTHHPFYSPEYDSEFLGEDEIILVTDNGNTDFEKGVAYSDIETLPIIDTNFLYGATRHSLFPIRHQFQLECDVAACAVPLLIGSKWYAILARKQVEREISLGSLREIPIRDGEIPPVQNYIVYRKDNKTRNSVSKMLSVVYSARKHSKTFM